MAALQITDDQIVDLVRQLPPATRADLLLKLSTAGRQSRTEIRTRMERRIREVCRERGLDWDSMDDEARQDFVEDWLEED